MFTALRLSRSQRYLLNGNWALGFSNEFEAAGTVFQYYRPQLHSPSAVEYITAAGPTNESVDIMVSKTGRFNRYNL